MFIEHVESLGRCLGEFDIDLYLPSFPAGGCAEALAAMASGTPVLSHRNYLSPFGSATDDIVYPEARRWRNFTDLALAVRSEEHTSELQSLMRISYAVFCLK